VVVDAADLVGDVGRLESDEGESSVPMRLRRRVIEHDLYFRNFAEFRVEVKAEKVFGHHLRKAADEHFAGAQSSIFGQMLRDGGLDVELLAFDEMRQSLEDGVGAARIDEDDEPETAAASRQSVHFDEGLLDDSKVLEVGLDVGGRRILRKSAEKEFSVSLRSRRMSFGKHVFRRRRRMRRFFFDSMLRDRFEFRQFFHHAPS